MLHCSNFKLVFTFSSICLFDYKLIPCCLCLQCTTIKIQFLVFGNFKQVTVLTGCRLMINIQVLFVDDSGSE